MYHSCITLSLALLFLLFSVPAASQTTASKDGALTDSLTHANTLFAMDMYHQLHAVKDNVFISPYSISAALGMTYAGARGKTESEMRTALHFSRTFDPHAAFRELDLRLHSHAHESGQKLSIANGLCVTGGRVRTEFRSLLKENYDAEIFSGEVGQINDWVKKQTDGRIEKIMERIPTNTVCVLLNAIYFKGRWKYQFNPARTRTASFHVSSGTRMPHPFMQQEGRFRMIENADFQAVSLPYEGDRLSMVVLLPKKTDGINALEEDLNAENLTRWLNRLDASSPQIVDLYFPKFSIESDYDLLSGCRRLGMIEAFLPEAADFRGMGWAAGDLWIGQIKHRAVVEVNEEGSEAAAATGIGMQTKSTRQHPSFRADHPFLFLIRDNETGSILFMGRLSHPVL